MKSGSPALTTHWPVVFLLIGAGIVSAFQVGKAPMALDAVRADLGLDLATASWLISAFALIGAFAGAPIGLTVDRVGARRMLIGGLLLQGAGSTLGAASPGLVLLLTSRSLEGLGFLAVIVAAPALIAELSPIRERGRAMALWATFMPVGMTVILLAAPILSLLEWRGFWLLNAAILGGYALLSSLKISAPSVRTETMPDIGEALGQALTAPGPWFLGGIFAAFAACFFAVFGFLPSILSTRLGVEAEAASLLSALAVAASGFGNLLCGRLLARGFRPLRLLLASFAIISVCSVGIFSQSIAANAAYLLCIVFSLAGGLIPVVVFDSAPRYAPRPELLGATLGFAMQGNNLGLLLGPAAAGAIATRTGWPMVSALITGIALLAALLVFGLHAASRHGTAKSVTGKN